MTAYVSAKAGGRRLPPVRLGWGDLVVGVGLGFLVWLSVAAGQTGRLETAASLLSKGARTAPSPRARARLSPAEERQVRRVLAEARESRRAAVAFYAAMHEADPQAGARVHAAEIQALVDGVVGAGLEPALGSERARSVYGASGPTSLTVSGP